MITTKSIKSAQSIHKLTSIATIKLANRIAEELSALDGAILALRQFLQLPGLVDVGAAYDKLVSLRNAKIDELAALIDNA